MTSKERMQRILACKDVDRIGCYESFWGETQAAWAAQGHVKPDTDLLAHFGYDMRSAGWFNVVADLDFKDEVVEETAETKLVRNGNGALLRWHKLHASTPEHVDFLVKDRAGWDKHTRPRLLRHQDYPRRVDVEGYRKARARCAEQGLFFCWGGVSVFECMHPLCGHEHMLMGMALDPDWVKDMADTYAQLTLDLFEYLFTREGLPDGLFFYEDMGFKEHPFMSPAMYRELIWPAHKRLFDYGKSHRLPVIVHSCGFVEPLVPGMIEAGMDCLQAMEVKAGMDLPRLKRLYGDRIAFMGGLDVRTMVANDLDAVEAELQAKLPVAMEHSGYILHSDHSIPPQVNYDTYRYFLRRGLEIGTY